jgi:hypothetical protein
VIFATRMRPLIPPQTPEAPLEPPTVCSVATADGSNGSNGSDTSDTSGALTQTIPSLDGPEIVSQVNDAWRVTAVGLVLCLETRDSEVGWIVTVRANTLERLVEQAVWDPLGRREVMRAVRLGLRGSRC